VIGKVLQVGCKVTSIRSSEQISSTSLRCPFTKGKGRTYQRSVPLFEGRGTRALREDAVPYSPKFHCAQKQRNNALLLYLRGRERGGYPRCGTLHTRYHPPLIKEF
jgi:hypothetical protein